MQLALLLTTLSTSQHLKHTHTSQYTDVPRHTHTQCTSSRENNPNPQKWTSRKMEAQSQRTTDWSLQISVAPRCRIPLSEPLNPETVWCNTLHYEAYTENRRYCYGYYFKFKSKSLSLRLLSLVLGHIISGPICRISCSTMTKQSDLSELLAKLLASALQFYGAFTETLDAWTTPGLHAHHHWQWVLWKCSCPLCPAENGIFILSINPSTQPVLLNSRSHFKLNNHFCTSLCDYVIVA